MQNYEILDKFIFPLLVTIIGGIIVGIVIHFITNSKYYDQRREKLSYLHQMHNLIDNSFQKCINININNQKQLNENFNSLKEIVTTIYKLSTEPPLLINIGDDKYVINQIKQSGRDLYNKLSETEESFLQSTKNKQKIELYNLRNDVLIFCYNNKTTIYDLFNDIQD